MRFKTTNKAAREEIRITPRLTWVRDGNSEKYIFSYDLGGTKLRRTWSGARRAGWSGAEPFVFDAECAYFLPPKAPTVEDAQKIFDSLFAKEEDEKRNRRAYAGLTCYWREQARKASTDAGYAAQIAEAAAERAEKSTVRMFIAAALAVAASLCAVLSHWTHFQP